MSDMNRVASDLYKALTEQDERKPQSGDYKATVVRDDSENGLVWVKFPGGEDETPVSKTNNANVGDEILVRLKDGRAWVLGNDTSPATDNTVANQAGETAGNALQNAGIAQDAANKALDDAASAYRFAGIAQESAENAQASAEAAQSSADDAALAAASAISDAASALLAAGTANRSANAALTQLSVVEDVVGVLSWISEHADYELTTDTEVVEGKLYFTRSGDVYTPVSNPTGNPSSQGYYEIDEVTEAVSNYVSSHLSLTNAGLWVINDSNSYKILLASDGMKVYDALGNLVATYGESITWSSNRSQYIGGENAYIVFNQQTGVMTIGGSNLNISGNVTIGGQTRSLTQVLADMQSEIDGSIESWYYAGVPTASNLPASNWTTTAQKNQHLRDLYFDTDTGHSYRWALDNNVYKWIEIEDTDATAALALAQQADTKADNAIKTVEYAVGTSSSTAPSSGWSTNSPTWEAGKYVWMRQSKDGVNYTYTCIQGAKGEAGQDGASGAQGPAGPEGLVTVYPTALDITAGTATLAATLRVNGVITTPTSYSWTKGTETLVLATTSTLNVDDLNAVYNCTVTW